MTIAGSRASASGPRRYTYRGVCEFCGWAIAWSPASGLWKRSGVKVVDHPTECKKSPCGRHHKMEEAG